MPTLRTRPSRGSDVLLDAVKSVNSPSKTPTRRGHRKSGAMAADAIEVRESIEAKGDVAADEDVVMGDAIDATAVKDEVVADVDAPADSDPDADADGEVDADGEPDDDPDADADGEPDDADITQHRRDLRELLNLIDETQSYLSNYKDDDGAELAQGFQRLPNKRFLPDYFEVIKTPIAFSTVRAKILKKGYTSFTEFVQDVAQIFHNAQVYNRPSAGIFEAAVRLRNIFKDKLQEYVSKGLIKPEEAELPDLGEIPEVEDSPPPEDDEDEEEEEDEEEDDDDSDDEGTRRRGRRRGRRSTGKKDLDDDDVAPAQKRGRPPKVFTPLEGRIYAILKGLRRFKNENGELRVLPFERLPDKGLEKDYYAVIKNPIALDGIKRNYKRKKYYSVDQVLADLDLLFENAKAYNEEGSEVYEDAVELQKQAHILGEQEKAKPDDAFRDEDGKLPLAGIEYKGEIWKVGDWVHINNPNDPRKPIVAQIYRTWQDREGHKWFNACWYYRPEQTVHHYEKHFYENEVVKTGQYRDHRIEEIDDRCFVMFITRYPKGRPRGFPANKSVYVCETRYNEEKFKFNKIKTWASCLPDEVREKDYEMDLFPVPMRMKKVPSPIKHLLQVDAKETDDLPKPTWANANAPPIIGAVHRRPREPNESPPPEPTPPPMAAPLVPQMPMDPSRRQSFNRGDVTMTGTYQPTHAIPGPSPSPLPHYQQFPPTPGARPTATPTPPVPVPQFQLPPMMPNPPTAVPQPPMPQPPHYSPHAYSHQQQFTPGPIPPSPVHHHQVPSPMAVPYNQSPRHVPHSPAMMTQQSRTPMAPAANVNTLPHANAQHQQQYTSQYNVPRPYEVYRLMDPQLEAAVPESVREQFQRDDEGRLLWFTAAGRDRSALRGVAPEYAGLGHSVGHLAHIGEVREERRRKRKERDEALARDEEARRAKEGGKGGRTEEEARRRDEARDELVERALVGLARQIEKGTEVVEEGLGGWREEKRLWEAERAERRGKA